MHGVTGYLARIELRRQARTMLLLTLLVAVVAGTVLTAVAGARRTRTAPDRYFAQYGATELYVGGDLELFDQLREVEGVEAVSTFELVAAMPVVAHPDEFFPLVAPRDDLLGQAIMRGPIVEGRAPDPRAPLEVAVGERTARRLDVSVGSPLELATFTPSGAEAIFTETGSAEPDGPPVTLHVVGIERQPGDLGGRETDVPFTILTPAFAAAHDGVIGDIGLGALVDVAGGHSVADVTAAFRALGVEDIDSTLSADHLRGMIDPVMTSLATALATFAAVLAVAGVVAFAQVAGRSTAGAAADDGALAALGCPERDRFLRMVAAPAVAVVLGSGVGALASVLASPLHPIGLARRVDPDLGFQVDGLVVLAGTTGIVVVGLAIVAGVAGLALRRAGTGVGPTAPGRAAVAAADLGAPVPVVAGLGFAAVRRSGSAGAVRAAMTGTVVGVMGVLAALVVGASMDRLLSTPSLYGWGWDVVVAGADRFHLDDDELGERLAAAPGVAGADEMIFNLAVDVDGQPVFAVVHEPRGNGISPVVVRGRGPATATEIALGGDTAWSLGVGIGDQVRVNLRQAADATVVGVVALPVTSDGGTSASGAVVTQAGADALGFSGSCSSDATCYRGWVVRFADGADPADLARHASLDQAGAAVYFPTPPGEVEQLQSVEHLPWVLAGFLALLAVVALLHAAAATVRRRRRDLAILRTLGCTARQLRAIVSVQVVALTSGGAVLGALLGVVGGRQVWQLVVDRMSLPFAAEVPLLAVVLVPVATIVLAQLAATRTRRAAATVRPAEALRAE